MINPVKYVLYDSQVPDSNPPVIVVRTFTGSGAFLVAYATQSMVMISG